MNDLEHQELLATLNPPCPVCEAPLVWGTCRSGHPGDAE